MKINSVLYKGLINKELQVVYNYSYETSGQFQTIIKRDNGTVYIKPSFAISISEGFNKSHMFIPNNKYHQFTLLLSKTIKQINKNLYVIFPNVSNDEFEIDARVLERFQTEQAMNIGGMTMIPCVWVDQTNGCFPGVRINSLNGSVDIPLEDAMSISQMFNTFEPNQFGLTILNMFNK